MERASKSYQIYALIDPRDSLVHYIGMSIDAQMRFYDHLYLSRSNEAKQRWIAELRQEGLHPILQVLETINAGPDAYFAACDREYYWICEMWRSGSPLVNASGITRPYLPIGVKDTRKPPHEKSVAKPARRRDKVKTNIKTELARHTQWLSVEYIAHELDVPVDRVRAWIRHKKLRAFRFGWDYRIRREDYDRFIEERATKPEDYDTDD